jgi:rhodanese-related sulfurtransferase
MKQPGGSSVSVRSGSGIAFETGAVALSGLVLALLANQLSPRGIELSRDYFPERPTPSVQTSSPETRMVASEGEQRPDDAAGLDAAVAEEALEVRLRERGLQLARLAEVEAWFHDPDHELESIIFVDARNRSLYQEGHVPAAYRFDHFYPQDTLAEVLPAALAARLVIVYCNGGDCEDSEFAALMLLNAGVQADRLRVYAGGLEEWRDAGLAIEVGERRSGILEQP